MESEVVKYAPKAVIEELDAIDLSVNSLYEVLDSLEREEGDYKNAQLWYGGETFIEANFIQLALVNHIMGVERLQPERETRYYVQNSEHGNTYIEMNGDAPAEWDFNAHGNPNWQNGMTKEQADGYAALFGGEPKEIK